MQLRLQVRAVFQQLKESSWLVVDASQSAEQIHEQVGRLAALQQHL
jgi:thymidylate kinase